jgi:acyl-coenzyme A synthetase/AMP-(fatty) acid ligase
MTDVLVHAFDALRRADAGAPAVLGPGREITRAGLDASACAAMAAVDPESPFGAAVLQAPDGLPFLSGFLALRRAGLAAILADARMPAAEVDRVAGRLGARAVFSWDGEWTWRPCAGLPRAYRGVAAVKLTSGSTGEPRGVEVTAEHLVADEAQIASTMGIVAADRILGAIPMSHSYGLSSVAVPVLTRGCPAVLPDAGAGPWAALEAAERWRATVFPTVPAFLQALVRLESPPPPPDSVRLVLTAGAPLDPATARRFRERFGLSVHVFYGSSETGGICYDRPGGAGERGTVGTPMDGVRVTLDPEAGTVVVASAAVVGGEYRTLDAAEFTADGELRLLGRDDVINVRGRKVHPREVEGVIAACEGVREVVVIGDGDVLRAVVACEPGAVDRETLVARCRERLSPHKVPRSFVFVEELPRTDRGKLDRAALSALA